MLFVAACIYGVFKGQNGGIQMRKLGLVLVTFMMLSLTGCIHEYRLSEEATDVAAEYMAGILLEYDENYEKELLNREELEALIAKEGREAEDSGANSSDSKPTKAPDRDVQSSDGEEASDQPTEDISISEVIKAEGFDISYKSYKLYNVYPEDETGAYFSLTPMEGNQLFVVSFIAKNLTDKEKRLDLKKSKVDYQLDINVGSIYKPLPTLLENNLKYIDMKFGAGKKEEVLLVFEIPKDMKLNDINLIISNGAKTEIIDIK